MFIQIMVKNGITSNLAWHLRQKHPTIDLKKTIACPSDDIETLVNETNIFMTENNNPLTLAYVDV